MKCSLGISNFLEEISSLSHSVVFLYFFALIAEEWVAEKRAGSGHFRELVENARESEMEKAGVAFRKILEARSE